MNLKEFIAIMVAAFIITTALYTTNRPVATGSDAWSASPRLAVQFSTNYKDYQEPRYTPSSGTWTEPAIGYTSTSPGSTNTLGSFFGAIWRWGTALFQF